MECDGAIRNIEKEILRECSCIGIEIHSNFLNYYIKLLALNPKWGISSNATISRTDVQKFIKYIVSQLRAQKSANIVTLRLQFYFNCNYTNREKMARKNRDELLLRLKHLRNEILDTKEVSEDNPIEEVYKKIVFYTTLAAGLGNPTIEGVYNEARVALGSIMDARELLEFVEQPKYLKEEQLEELCELVTGIRLFNRDCAKGGVGIEDLPRLIHEAVDATNRQLETALISTMDKVNLLTTAIDLIHVNDKDERGRFIINVNIPESAQMADVEYVKDFLIVYRQLEIYLRKLLQASDKIDYSTDTIFANLQETFEELHEVVKHRIAIPVNEVFPLFKSLFEIWMQLQDQTVVLAKINRIMTNILAYVNELQLDPAIPEMLMPPEETPMTDAERLDRNRDDKISQHGNNCLVRDMMDLHEKDRLQYLGFCPVKLVKTGGALIPANPYMGVLSTMHMNFAFAEAECGAFFGQTPEKYIMEVIELARRKPELIDLLQLKEQVELVQEIKDLVQEPPLLPITAECDTQTDTHLVEEHIDKEYMWNVWDLRRKAMILANISNKQTVSSQSMKSMYRVGVKVQTTEPRDKELQTKQDNYSNVPKPSTFIFGLRGRKDDKQFIVDLTRPVEE